MINYTEAKRLVARWGRGTLPNRQANIRYHALKRGNNDVWRYLRKAYNFNKKGAVVKLLPENRVHLERKSGEFLIEHNGYIVTYGFNRPQRASR